MPVLSSRVKQDKIVDKKHTCFKLMPVARQIGQGHRPKACYARQRAGTTHGSVVRCRARPKSLSVCGRPLCLLLLCRRRVGQQGGGIEVLASSSGLPTTLPDMKTKRCDGTGQIKKQAVQAVGRGS